MMWFNPGGNEMSEEEWTFAVRALSWHAVERRCTDVLNFEGRTDPRRYFLLLINAHYEPISFVLPGQEHIEWQLILDTADPNGFLADPKRFASGDDVDLGGRACCLLQLISGTEAQAREESWKKRHVEFPALSAEQERAEL